MNARTLHTVNVWDVRCVFSVYQKSKRAWLVVGEFAGKRIEVQGLSKNSALAAWRKAALASCAGAFSEQCEPH
jgi:hypothetical protein